MTLLISRPVSPWLLQAALHLCTVARHSTRIAVHAQQALQAYSAHADTCSIDVGCWDHLGQQYHQQPATSSKDPDCLRLPLPLPLFLPHAQMRRPWSSANRCA